MARARERVAALIRQHVRELDELEREELERLLKTYERARLELLGRLNDLPGDRFSAQQVRGALLQAHAAIRSMVGRLYTRRERRQRQDFRLAIRQVMELASAYEPEFRQAMQQIQAAALRNMAAPGKLLLQQYETSLRTYGGSLIGDMQRRLSVHLVRKSTIPEMARDLAGNLRSSGFGPAARWRAERIVRTEMMNAIGTAQLAGIESAGMELPGLQAQWSATRDERVCDFCAAADGRVRAPGQPFGTFRGQPVLRPPAHPNDRCGLVPFHPRWGDAA